LNIEYINHTDLSKKGMWWISDPPYIFLDAFVMMPNRVHGIVVIAEGEVGTGKGKALIV